MTKVDTQTLAEALVQARDSLYGAGRSCPLCGYDGVWPCDSEQSAIQHVKSQLDNALAGEILDDD